MEFSQDIKIKAVIYCRVSSRQQVREGSGLDSQEQRCREFAKKAGLEVVQVFRDHKTGGGDFLKRPGMRDLLSFVGQKKKEMYVVIFDDLKRISRDTMHHWRLREALASRNALLRCLNHVFDDTPEGRFFETLLAAQGQLEREQQGRQTNQKMRARLESGYWVFKAGHGYKYEKAKAGGGKVLVRDEPLATIVQTALQGFASGRFATPADVRIFLESKEEFPKANDTGDVRYEAVDRLLRRVLYTGHLEHADWGISLRPGHHPALITLAEHQLILDKLDGKKSGFTRKDEHPDFPLRGIVACGDCGKPMTGGWTTKPNSRYAYYRCQTKGCPFSGKSVPRKKIEEDMCDLLERVTPSKQLLKVAEAMIGDVIEVQEAETLQAARSASKEMEKLEASISALVDRIATTSNANLIEAYERRLIELEGQKPFLAERIAVLKTREGQRSESIELAMGLLANPCDIYKKGNHKVKRLVAKLTFEGPVEYSKDGGYRTPKLSLPFKALSEKSAPLCEMVPPHGLEPRTY